MKQNKDITILTRLEAWLDSKINNVWGAVVMILVILTGLILNRKG